MRRLIAIRQEQARARVAARKVRAPFSGLGVDQLDVLRALCLHGFWYQGGAWIWRTPSFTARVLQRLVERGYARTDGKGRYMPEPWSLPVLVQA